MNMEVLLSCMNQPDTGIVKQINAQSDIVIVNQCDTNGSTIETFVNENGNPCRILFISTTERGLSRSRNMAIRNAQADICLISDDDELLEPDYRENILQSFEQHPEADLIAFNLLVNGKHQKEYGNQVKKVGKLMALRISSVQIAFRRQVILEKGLFFDEEMGAGTGHGAGEENKFLYDCIDKGLHIIFVPIDITNLQERHPSTWFNGFNETFYLQKGWATKRYMGKFYATLFAFYTTLAKRRLYQENCSSFCVLKAMLRGIYSKNVFKS